MRVLIVEDEPGIYNFLQQGLEEESFVVDIAEEGDSGLVMAMSGGYDIILLDWMVPGTSGLEICRNLRVTDKVTPVLFLTAKDTVGETVTGLQSGANDYIKKPFHFEELLERIKVQLRNKTNAESVYTLGDITMDTVSRRVIRAGLEIVLTQREFDLLEYLLKNKDQVCKRKAIIEDVWDIHFEYNSGVIDVYINALRKKLNLTEKDNYIQTIRGVGYVAREI